MRRDGHPKGPRLLPAIEVWADHAPNPDLTRYSPGHPNDSEYEPQGHSDDTTNAHSHPSNVEVERGRDRVGPNKAALSRLIDSLRRSAKTTPRVALVTGWPSYPAFSPTLGRRNFCRTRTRPKYPYARNSAKSQASRLTWFIHPVQSNRAASRASAIPRIRLDRFGAHD